MSIKNTLKNAIRRFSSAIFCADLFIIMCCVGAIAIQSCNKNDAQETPHTPEPKPIDTPNPDPNDPKNRVNAHLEQFLKTPGSGDGFSFDIKNTNHYYGLIPPAAFLFDYNHKGKRSTPTIAALANIPRAFEAQLPKPVKDALASHNLLGTGLVDIRFVIQWNNGLGEKADHGGIPTTTRISAHGWADPDAPASYAGNRDASRDYLHGVFLSPKDISTPQHPMNQLISSPIHIHDNLFSPRADTDLIKYGSNDEATAFWIVVIDHKNPDGKVKGLANLIWLFDQSKYDAFNNLTRDSNWAPKFKTFGELLGILRGASEFQNWHGLNLLNDLLAAP